MTPTNVTVWPGGQENPSWAAVGGDSVMLPTRLPFLSAVNGCVLLTVVLNVRLFEARGF